VLKKQAIPGSRILTVPQRSLAFGVASAPPRTMYALAPLGGIAAPPRNGHRVLFGRNPENVHVSVGEDDLMVSRQHGTITHRHGLWWVGNIGRRPIRLADRYLFPGEEEVPLRDGYTPLAVDGSSGREHLVELYVATDNGKLPPPLHRHDTPQPNPWPLEPAEKLALTVLAQRYLFNDHYPRPLSYREVADCLRDLQPDAEWTEKKVEHLVADVRKRLSKKNVRGLTRQEVGHPVGSTLNENLIQELLRTTTLTPRDLALLEDPYDPELLGIGKRAR